MAVAKYKYKDIDHTLKQLRRQVVDSYDFAYQTCPEFDNPEDLFYWLKTQVIYKNDPPGVEYLQTMETLYSNDKYNRAGEGDCDCFVITTLACLKVSGWDDVFIILAGRHKDRPSHIYSGVGVNGDVRYLDLTNPYYDMERKYKFKQILSI